MKKSLAKFLAVVMLLTPVLSIVPPVAGAAGGIAPQSGAVASVEASETAPPVVEPEPEPEPIPEPEPEIKPEAPNEEPDQNTPVPTELEAADVEELELEEIEALGTTLAPGRYLLDVSFYNANLTGISMAGNSFDAKAVVEVTSSGYFVSVFQTGFAATLSGLRYDASQSDDNPTAIAGLTNVIRAGFNGANTAQIITAGMQDLDRSLMLQMTMTPGPPAPQNIRIVLDANSATSLSASGHLGFFDGSSGGGNLGLLPGKWLVDVAFRNANDLTQASQAGNSFDAKAVVEVAGSGDYTVNVFQTGFASTLSGLRYDTSQSDDNPTAMANLVNVLRAELNDDADAKIITVNMQDIERSLMLQMAMTPGPPMPQNVRIVLDSDSATPLPAAGHLGFFDSSVGGGDEPELQVGNVYLVDVSFRQSADLSTASSAGNNFSAQAVVEVTSAGNFVSIFQTGQLPVISNLRYDATQDDDNVAARANLVPAVRVAVNDAGTTRIVTTQMDDLDRSLMVGLTIDPPGPMPPMNQDMRIVLDIEGATLLPDSGHLGFFDGSGGPGLQLGSVYLLDVAFYNANLTGISMAGNSFDVQAAVEVTSGGYIVSVFQTGFAATLSGLRYDAVQSDDNPTAIANLTNVIRAELNDDADAKIITSRMQDLDRSLMLQMAMTPGPPMPQNIRIVLDEVSAVPLPDSGHLGFFVRGTAAEVDRSSLRSLITQATGLAAQDYTQSTFQNLQAALTAARVVYDDTTATQTAVDGAVTALQAAIDALVDISELRALIALVEQLTPQDYTQASFQALVAALNSARTVRNNPTATQTAVDAAYNALRQAFNSLELRSEEVVSAYLVRISARNADNLNMPSTADPYYHNYAVVETTDEGRRFVTFFQTQFLGQIRNYTFDSSQSDNNNTARANLRSVLLHEPNPQRTAERITVNWGDLSRSLMVGMTMGGPDMPHMTVQARMVLDMSTARPMTNTTYMGFTFWQVIADPGGTGPGGGGGAGGGTGGAGPGSPAVPGAVSPDQMTDGRYTVNVSFWNANGSGLSMADASLNPVAVIDRSGGRMTMSISTRPIQVGRTEGYLRSLSVNGGGASVIARNISGGRPSAFSFPLPNTNSIQPVSFQLGGPPPVPQIPLGGQLRINWGTLQRADGARLSGNTAIAVASLDDLEDIERSAETTEAVAPEPILGVNEAFAADGAGAETRGLSAIDEMLHELAALPWWAWAGITLGIIGAVAAGWLLYTKKVVPRRSSSGVGEA